MTNSTPSEKLSPPASESLSTTTQKKHSQKNLNLAKTSSKVLVPANAPSQPSCSKSKTGKLDVRNRKTEALRRLGLNPEQMVGVPRITFQLEHAEGGLEQVIEALRGSDETDAQAFIRKYDTCSASDLDKLTLEEVAVAAGIRPLDLLGVATKALFQQSQTVAGVIAASAHHKVVAKNIQMALNDKGVRDREMHLTATGHLPLPKGTVIFNQRTQVANFNAPGGHEGAVEGDPEIPSAPDLDELPSMDEDIMALQKTSRKLLEANTIEATPFTPKAP